MFPESLLFKQYIGFDLDDTLHSYRTASTKANNAVFHYLATIHSNLTSFPVLRHSHDIILKSSTKDAFRDGRTSTEHRQERFLALMKQQRIPCDDREISVVLDLYEECLKHCLELKKGAKDLLSAVKKLGKTVILITEGPKDAQDWTVQNLGLSDSIDMIFVSSDFQNTKSEGLFEKVLKSLNIQPDQLLYIGDSFDQDILPARMLNIPAIHFNECSNKSLRDCAGGLLETGSLLDIANEFNLLGQQLETSCTAVYGGVATDSCHVASNLSKLHLDSCADESKESPQAQPLSIN